LFASHPGGMESAWLGDAKPAVTTAMAAVAAHLKFITRI
jgi:hypothetical protein